MKPEEQVRADFEAWHTIEFGSCDWHNANHANRWIGYQAAYSQARREALEPFKQARIEAEEFRVTLVFPSCRLASLAARTLKDLSHD